MSDYAGRIIRATEPTVTTTSASGVWTVEEALKYKQAGTWPTPVYADPNFKQTVLLLHGDGTNGAQNNTFLDSSTNNFTITRNGNTTQGTFSPFSVGAREWSNYFDGSGDYLSSPNNAAIHVLGSDFCLEGWFYLTAAQGDHPLYSAYTNTSGYLVRLGATFIRFYCESSPTDIIVDRNYTFNQGQWYHFAVTNSGGTGRIFINGVLQGATFGFGTPVNSTTTLQIGRTHTLTDGFPGYLSNFRIVKGSPVYTSDFTPSTTPLTAITNTSLLTCQSNRFVDNSTNAFAITRNGDVRVTPFSPFAPTAAYSAGTNGGSGYFDGSGDYLTVADNAAFTVGSGNWTLEAWVYPTASPNQPIIFGQWSGSTDGSIAMMLSNDANRYLRGLVYSGGFVDRVSNSSLQLNAWNHCAFVREGTYLNLYLNGVRVDNYNWGSSSIQDSSLVVSIGASSSGSQPFQGNISNARFVKGTAIYSGATYTVPTAPLTAITNTSLLLNFTNAGIFDNTGKNNLETVGNAQIDTTTKKYGTGSMEFDGTGDYLMAKPNPELELGSGDYTIECWVNISAAAANGGIVSKGPVNGLTATTWSLEFNGSANTVSYYVQNANNGAYIINGTSNIKTSTWIHLAITRSGNNTRFFVNGTQEGSTYTSGYTIAAGDNLYIGGGFYAPTTRTITGFIDDLRITKGVARYTSNFTPPTAPFLDQ